MPTVSRSEMTFDFAINPDARAKLFRIGPEQDPLIVIDGLMRSPNDLVDCAAGGSLFGAVELAPDGTRSSLAMRPNPGRGRPARGMPAVQK